MFDLKKLYKSLNINAIILNYSLKHIYAYRILYLNIYIYILRLKTKMYLYKYKCNVYIYKYVVSLF